MSQLVTIPVLTYNAAEFVEETLESVYHQTHQNIELIISDDCSKDTTVELVEKWCSQPRVQARFADIKILTVPKNTGVSANCNRCIQASTADWIKFIAGDDILLPNCIEDNLKFVATNNDAKIIFSQVHVYQDTFQEVNYKKTTPMEFPVNFMEESLTAQDQFRLLLVSDRIHYTPSYFFNKKTLKELGCYDETNMLVEDYPMWLKLTQSGEKLFYFHKVTVGYRIHSKATNNSGDNVLFKPSIFNSYKIRKELAHPYLPWEIVKSEQIIYLISKVFDTVGWNTNIYIYKTLYTIGCFYINPFHYIYAIKKRMPKNKKNPFYS